MTYINFITGLIIAAVLSVPGAMQHEATQVEEELVVEETMLQEEWFILVGLDPQDPLHYEKANGDESICTGTTGVCAINAVPVTGIPGGQPGREYPTMDAQLLAVINTAISGVSSDPNRVSQHP